MKRGVRLLLPVYAVLVCLSFLTGGCSSDKEQPKQENQEVQSLRKQKTGD
jgi:hypothetical protein